MDFVDLVITVVSQSVASRRGTWTNRANPRSSRSGLFFRNRRELRIGTPFRAIKASSNLFSTAQTFARRSPDTSDSIGQDRAIAHFAISSISRSAGSYVSNVSQRIVAPSSRASKLAIVAGVVRSEISPANVRTYRTFRSFFAASVPTSKHSYVFPRTSLLSSIFITASKRKKRREVIFFLFVRRTFFQNRRRVAWNGVPILFSLAVGISSVMYPVIAKPPTYLFRTTINYYFCRRDKQLRSIVIYFSRANENGL